MIAYIYFNPKKHPQTLVRGGSRCHGKMKLAPGALTSGDRHCQLLPEQEGDLGVLICKWTSLLLRMERQCGSKLHHPSLLQQCLAEGVCLPWARSGQHQQVYGPWRFYDGHPHTWFSPGALEAAEWDFPGWWPCLRAESHDVDKFRLTAFTGCLWYLAVGALPTALSSGLLFLFWTQDLFRGLWIRSGCPEQTPFD